jgi:hypothetical protein
LLAYRFHRLFFDAFAVIKNFEFLQIFKRLFELGACIFTLPFKILRGLKKIVAALNCSACISRIGEMRAIRNARAGFFCCDFAVKFTRHSFEFRNHGFDLRKATALLINLEPLQAHQGIT